MLYKEFIPHPALQQHIKCFWVFENSYGENHLERMIPDGFIDLVFHYGQRPKLIIEGKEIHKPSDFLGGHLVNAALLKFSGDLKMFGIKFYPWASATLYKMPAYELNNLRIPVSAILGNWTNDYYGMMHEELNEGRYHLLIAKLEAMLMKKIPQQDNQQLMLKYCFEKIFNTDGNISVETVSNQLGYSSRFVQKLFKYRKGKSFQFYCRLARLQSALKNIDLHQQESFTGTAHACGYFDQSHFIKDFTSFTGLSPKKFFEEEHLYVSKNLDMHTDFYLP